MLKTAQIHSVYTLLCVVILSKQEIKNKIFIGVLKSMLANYQIIILTFQIFKVDLSDIYFNLSDLF